MESDDMPSFSIYDHSEGIYHSAVPSDSDNCVWLDQGSCMIDYLIESPFGIYNQSSLQAFYFFEAANIGCDMITTNDWIGAFNGDIVVGARQWNGEFTDIPVYGDDGSEWTIGYMEDGGIPSFKIWQQISGEDGFLYYAEASEDIPWYNNEQYILDSVNTVEDISNLEITNIHIENNSNPDLGMNALDGDNTEVIITIENTGSTTTCPYVEIGIVWNDIWDSYNDEPAYDESFYIYEPIEPGISYDLLIDDVLYYYSSYFEYGQNAIAVKIDPGNPDGDFYRGADQPSGDQKYIGWIEPPSISDYRWPVPDGATHQITSVVNEYRNTMRIHQGIDMTAPGGTQVVSVSSGRFIETGNTGDYDEFLTFGNENSTNFSDLTGFRYFHINKMEPDLMILNSDNGIYALDWDWRINVDWIYKENTLFAYVDPDHPGGPHIHLDDYTSGEGVCRHAELPKHLSSNPLRGEGIDDDGMVDDENLPMINPDGLMIIRSYPIAGENLYNHLHPDDEEFQYPKQYACIPSDGTDIDLVIQARDVGANGQCQGIAKIEWRLLDNNPDLEGPEQVYPPLSVGTWACSVDLTQSENEDFVFYEHPEFRNEVTYEDNVYQNNVVDFLYCSRDCDDTDPYTAGDYVRYFLTNNIMEPDGSDTFSGHFNSTMADNADGSPLSGFNFIVEVRVTDFSGNTTLGECRTGCTICVDGNGVIKK